MDILTLLWLSQLCTFSATFYTALWHTAYVDQRPPGLQIGCIPVGRVTTSCIPVGRVTTSCIPVVETNKHLLGFCFYHF